MVRACASLALLLLLATGCAESVTVEIDCRSLDRMECRETTECEYWTNVDSAYSVEEACYPVCDTSGEWPDIEREWCGLGYHCIGISRDAEVEELSIPMQTVYICVAEAELIEYGYPFH